MVCGRPAAMIERNYYREMEVLILQRIFLLLSSSSFIEFSFTCPTRDEMCSLYSRNNRLLIDTNWASILVRFRFSFLPDFFLKTGISGERGTTLRDRADCTDGSRMVVRRWGHWGRFCSFLLATFSRETNTWFPIPLTANWRAPFRIRPSARKWFFGARVDHSWAVSTICEPSCIRSFLISRKWCCQRRRERSLDSWVRVTQLSSQWHTDGLRDDIWCLRPEECARK